MLHLERKLNNLYKEKLVGLKYIWTYYGIKPYKIQNKSFYHQLIPYNASYFDIL